MSQISDSAALVALALSLVAIGLTYGQLTQQTKVGRLGVYAEIMDHIGSDEARKARRIVKENKLLQELREKYPDSSAPLPALEADLEGQAKYLAAIYDRVGFILKHDQKMEEELLQDHGDAIAFVWKSLGRFVMEKWRDSDTPHYAPEFVRLGHRAVEYEEKLVRT